MRLRRDDLQSDLRLNHNSNVREGSASHDSRADWNNTYRRTLLGGRKEDQHLSFNGRLGANYSYAVQNAARRVPSWSHGVNLGPGILFERRVGLIWLKPEYRLDVGRLQNSREVIRYTHSHTANFGVDNRGNKYFHAAPRTFFRTRFTFHLYEIYPAVISRHASGLHTGVGLAGAREPPFLHVPERPLLRLARILHEGGRRVRQFGPRI